MTEEDWRVEGHEDLVGITLRRMPYFRWNESWDHDHCELCGAKFMTPEDTPPGYTDHGDPVQQEGYTNEGVEGGTDHYAWICVQCFTDLAERFDWRVAPGA